MGIRSECPLVLQWDYRLGGNPRPFVAREGSSLMLVPDEVRKSVAFICYNSLRRRRLTLAGTGFFVGIPVLGGAEEIGGYIAYLVTAKHVIEEIAQDTEDQRVHVRLNLKEGPAEAIATPLDEWIFHPEDSSVDVAILPWGPPEEIVDYVVLPRDMFVDEATITRESIGIGDEVFLTGLFSQHHGSRRNEPIVRIGNIAAIPEERVETKRYGLVEAYLIEVRSIGGLSGSPVFVQLSGIRTVEGRTTFPGTKFYLLGLIHGHWDLSATTGSDAIVEDMREERINMGIAIAVPATKIAEVIDQESLEDQRNEMRERLRMERGATADSAQQELTREGFNELLRRVSRPQQPPPDEGKSKT